MFTQESAIKYALKYIAAAKKLDIKIERAILFGSYSTGLQQEQSDIDLAIVSKDFTDNPLDNWKRIGPATIKFNLIEPHLFTWKDYKRKNSFIHEEIIKNGIEIPLHD